MKKTIDPGKSPINEYYCDGCQQLVIIEGIPLDEQPDSGKEFCVALNGSFGYNSPSDGLIFDRNYCGECGIKIVEALEALFKVKIESPIFEEIEEN